MHNLIYERGKVRLGQLRCYKTLFVLSFSRVALCSKRANGRFSVIPLKSLVVVGRFSTFFISISGNFHFVTSSWTENFPAEHSFSTFVQVVRQNLTEVRSNFNLEFVFVLGT